MLCISGEILTSNGFEKGYILIEKGIIKEVGKISPYHPDFKGYIIPKPVNAHTHIGDTFIKKKIRNLPRDVEKLVAPPDGLKHRLLREVKDEEIIQGMRESIRKMEELGISVFCDFRESGIKGVRLLKEAIKDFSIHSIILSRPRDLNFDEREILDLLKLSDGIGLSSLSDWDYDVLQKISNIAKRHGKIFSLHASERIREDIDKILDLKPDFLIHLCKASINDLERVSAESIPVVVCPRSNEFFGLKPRIEEMVNQGIKICIGTDNAMISDPDIFEEVRWIKRNCNLSIEEILRMITYNPREIFRLPKPEFEEDRKANLVVLHTKSLKPLFISG